MDSVRGLVGKWNADAAKARDAGNYGVAAGREDCADELESALAQAAGEAVECQFQDREGKWHSFQNDKHRDATIADGSWPIRYLYTTPADSAPLVEALLSACDDSDDAYLGTLSTKFVRDLFNAKVPAAQEPPHD